MIGSAGGSVTTIDSRGVDGEHSPRRAGVPYGRYHAAIDLSVGRCQDFAGPMNTSCTCFAGGRGDIPRERFIDLVGCHEGDPAAVAPVHPG